MKIPSKTFLIGEYLAMAGGPSLIACTEPYFFIACQKSQTPPQDLHPESPAGKLLAGKPLAFQIEDPHWPSGGFGRSTAEFIAVHRYLYPEEENKMWQRYKTITENGAFSPSGADLLAQMQGPGLFWIEEDKVTPTVWPFAHLDFQLLPIGKKYPTHEVLKNVNTIPYVLLKKIVLQAQKAMEEKDEQRFIEAIKNYQKTLYEYGLSLETTEQQCQIYEKENNILAAKGCGALGADVIAIFSKKT